METNLNIRSVRPKAYAILKRHRMRVATYHRSGQVRGWGNWSSGVLVVEDDGQVFVTAEAARWARDGSAGRLRDEAINILRGAGWTVADNGHITALP